MLSLKFVHVDGTISLKSSYTICVMSFIFEFRKDVKLLKLDSNCVTPRGMVLICQFFKEPKILKHVVTDFLFFIIPRYEITYK